MFEKNVLDRAFGALSNCVSSEEEFDETLYPIIDEVIGCFKDLGLKELNFKDRHVSVDSIMGEEEKCSLSLGLGCRNLPPFLSFPGNVEGEIRKVIVTPIGNTFSNSDMESKKWLLTNCFELCEEVRSKGRTINMLVSSYTDQVRKLLGPDVKTADDLVRALITKVFRLI